jgi:uncharacterized protein (TIRG00374 family)
MRNTTRVAKAAVSVAFFVVLFHLVRRADFVALFRQIDPLYFVLSLLLGALMIGVSCLKWKMLLDRQDTPVGFWTLMRIYFIGYYFSNLLPSNVGGDVVRSVYAGWRIGSQSLAVVSVFIERLTGLILLLVLVVLMPCFGGLYPHPAVLVPAAGAIGLLVLFFWIFRYTRPLSFFFRSLVNVLQAVARLPGARLRFVQKAIARLTAFSEKLHGKADSFHDKLQVAGACLKKDRRVMAGVIALTILFYVMTWGNVYLSFRAFGVAPPFATIAVVLPTAMTVAMAPITLGSLGIAEGSYVFYLGLLGISPAATLAMGLFLRFKMILAGLVGLFFHLSYKAKEGAHVPELRNAAS